ncbi:putative pectinesterase 63 [Ricinus communis]|uniref:Pectinesterase n=1 Tax=Ricinus communis TaxID=3988 RepID=B9RR45_RICCO|nr:putative pectinesterase 63 [Ricinus communis]EEF46216.1 Pectinesterase-3 precursor, putative [Ricinus communis]|eukprot:XP_002516214.1 putative pectinesterase 63 [Ricinus communis]
MKRLFFSFTSPCLIAFILGLQLLPAANSHSKQVPKDISKLKTWVADNINQFNNRKSDLSERIPRIILNKRLADAESSVRVITVAKRDDQFADFQSISDAIDSIPINNKQRRIIWIKGGEYFEKITINTSKPFITLYGDPGDMPKIVFNGTAARYGTVYSATVAVESKYFMAVNIAFVNSAPMPDVNKTGAQAVAMRISGDKAAFHNCKFVGFQDTLCDDRGRHVFRDCYIVGTVDFIFGNGKSLYLNTTIETVAQGTGVITAQARESVTDSSEFTFIHCNLTGIGNNTYLGRAWKERPRVVFAYAYMGSLINAAGWSTGKHPESNETVYYGEYKCKGPGAFSSGRVKYAKLLSDEEAKPFLSMTCINGNKWLIPPPEF